MIITNDIQWKEYTELPKYDSVNVWKAILSLTILDHSTQLEQLYENELSTKENMRYGSTIPGERKVIRIMDRFSEILSDQMSFSHDIEELREIIKIVVYYCVDEDDVKPTLDFMNYSKNTNFLSGSTSKVKIKPNKKCSEFIPILRDAIKNGIMFKRKLLKYGVIGTDYFPQIKPRNIKSSKVELRVPVRIRDKPTKVFHLHSNEDVYHNASKKSY